MMRKVLVPRLGKPAIMATIGAVAAVILFVACPGPSPPPPVQIDRIECPTKLFPGDECNILGSNLDLITEVQLGRGNQRVFPKRGIRAVYVL